MKKKLNGKEKKILEFLQEGEKTASEISGYLSINYYKTLRLLNQLKEGSRIEVFTFRNKTYYKPIKSCFGTKEFSTKSPICRDCYLNKECKKVKNKIPKEKNVAR